VSNVLRLFALADDTVLSRWFSKSLPCR